MRNNRLVPARTTRVNVSAKESAALARELSDDDVVAVSSSGNFAGYTYALQFVMHDLVGRGPSLPRSPLLDLESLYGHDPRPDGVGMHDGKFKLGSTLDECGVLSETEGDLYRVRGRALISDRRNDSNLFIAQFHLTMQKLHNALFNQLTNERQTIEQRFAIARNATIRSKHWAVVNDLIPTFAARDTWKYFLAGKKSIFFANQKADEFSLPLEFTHAVARFGHSLVNSAYFIGDELTRARRFKSANLDQAFENTWSMGLKKRDYLESRFSIDQQAMFDLSGHECPQVKERSSGLLIDLHVTKELRVLQRALNKPMLDSTAGRFPRSFEADVVLRNFKSGLGAQLPDAHEVFRDIKKCYPAVVKHGLIPSHPIPLKKFKANYKSPWLQKPSLWFYTLEEARVYGASGFCLGPLGSLIFADSLYAATNLMHEKLEKPKGAPSDRALKRLLRGRRRLKTSKAPVSYADLISLTLPIKRV